MKHVLSYSLLITAFAAGICQAQEKKAFTPTLSSPDSIRIVLENTRSVDATVVGNAFYTAWGNIGLDQQHVIQRHIRLMKKKKYPLRPTIVNYFGAIVDAVNIEHADAAKLSAYLRVAGLVIENYDTPKATNFFTSSRKFFQHHSLHYEKSFRLYARDDNYTFDFIAPPPIVNFDDTTQTVSPPEDTSTDQNANNESTTSDEEPVDTLQQSMPSWMTPPPQPYIEGPVITFDRVSLNFVTKFDSVFLRTTKGTFSLRDNIFMGEGGSFDWSSAGLKPDSVYCTLTTFNFNVSKPEFKAELVKLNYVGKTPGFIAGNFEFKSQPRKDSVASSYPRFKSYQSNLSIQGIGNDKMKYRGGFSLTGKKISSASVSGDYSVLDVFGESAKKFTVSAPDFEIQNSNISASKARVSIYQGNDSIVHPMVRMKYTFRPDTVQQLLLQKDKGLMHYTPYSSSFFNVDFSADIIRWDLRSDSMDLFTDGGRNTVPIVIESIDFYDPEDFRLLKS